MSYEQVIDDLFSRHQSVQSAGFTPDSYKPGLDAMLEFDAALGCPSKRLRCIHVAGTNGKGSVCSMLASALSASGYRVGLYTSPHLFDFRERLKVLDSGRCELVPREFVLAFLERWHRETANLSFFEITTGMAFSFFEEQKVDWAVIETGLGGRLDSTNIIMPEVSVITSVGLDHCAILGDTRREIAAEKAGIFKAGVPAVVAAADPETAPVFQSAAAKVGAPLIFADSAPARFSCGAPAPGRESAAENVSLPLDPTVRFAPVPPLTMPRVARFSCGSSRPGAEVVAENLDLNGPGQEMNLRTAKKTLEILGEASPAAARGLYRFGEMSGLRGRWEKLCDFPETICDIGHNPPALDANFGRLEQMRGDSAERRPLYVVYGVMRDKDLVSILHLFPSDAKYIFCAPSTPRALPSKELYATVKAARPELDCVVGPSGGDVAASVREAMEQAAALASPIVYVGGSTFVVSEALSIDK